MTHSYTDEEILDQLRLCKEKHGKCTPKLFRQEEDFCSVGHVIKRFSSWTEAKQAAGIEEDLRSETGRPKQYSNEQILAHLRECYERNGKCTTETLSQEEDLVSPSVVIERFKKEDDDDEGPGAWLRAKNKAGIADADERKNNSRPKKYSRKDYLDMIRACEKRYGKVTQRLFDDLDTDGFDDDDVPFDSFASVGGIRKEFDSWSNAKELAGVSEGERSRYTDEELLDMLRDCQERYGDCTAKKFASDDDFCSPETVQRRFGGWNDAKEKAGLMTPT